MSNPRLTIRSLVPSVKVMHNYAMEEENWLIIPTKRAIADLLTVVGHMRILLDDKLAHKLGIIGWLSEVEGVFKEVLISIDTNKLPIGIATSGDYEELDVIEDLLDNAWSTGWRQVRQIINKHPKSSGFGLLVYMIEYWVEEVKSRGWVIHGLLNGSESCKDIEAAFTALDKVNYPPRHEMND